MVVQYGTSMAYVPQHIPKPFASGAATEPTYTTQFGGESTGGSFRFYDAKANDSHLIWMHSNSGAFYDVWQFDTPVAAATAMATIGAAMAESTPPTFISINRDGTLGS